MLLRGAIPLAFVALWLLAASPAAAQHGPAPVLDPKAYASPSGEFQLHVNPANPSGAGAAAYRLTRRDDEVWAAEHPFAFWSAAVSDEGVAAAFAYTGGIDRVGQLVLAILDPHGKVRAREALPQEPSRFLHFPPVPRASGVFFHPGEDRVVFRIADKDINRDEEQWKVFRASDGASLGSFMPKRLAALEGARFIVGARPIPGTPLTLVHWFIYDEVPGSMGSMGAAFSLVDLEGRPVWTRELRGDYDLPDDAEFSTALRDRAFEHGIVSAASSRFEIWFAAEKQRVAFAIQPPAAPDGRWAVEETGRQPYDGPVPAPAPDAAAAEIEAIQLEHLGTIRLAAKAAQRPIRNISEFDLDAQGRLGFVRLEGSGKDRRCAFVLVDAEGKLLLEMSPDGFGGEGWWMEQIAWTGGDKWVVTTSPLDREAVARAWAIDAATGEVRPLEAFDAPRVEALCGTGGGTFAALVKQDFQYTSTTWLAAFDADGRQRWRVDSEHGDPQKLFAPADLAASGEGVVAVLSNIADDLKLYGPDGKHAGTIDLAKVLGRDPNYPASVAPDADDGWIVHDFSGLPPVWRIRQDQQAAASLSPRFDDGRQFRITGGVRLDHAGRLWTSDGHSLLQLDENGVVAKVLGTPPQPQELEQIAGLATDLQGRIYAADSRTGAIHVFDPATGNRLRLLVPEPTDFGDQLHLARIEVDGEGNVYLGGTLGVERVKFNPAGERVGRVAPPVAGFITDWLFSPAGTDQWVVRGLDSLVLVRDGKATRTVRRRPDDAWIGDVRAAAVGRDGSLVVTTPGTTPGASGSGVHLFAPDGGPVRSMPGPVAYEVGLAGKYAVVPVGAEVYLYARDGSAIRRFTPPPPEGAQDYWICLLAPNDQELWLHAAGTFQIERFALPD